MTSFFGYSGYLMIGAFVALANSGAVFAAWFLQSVAIQTYLFWAFLFVTLFFLATNWVSGTGLPPLGRGKTGVVVLINISTLANWGGYFLALKYIEPAVVTAILCGVGPVTIVAYKCLSRTGGVARHAALSSLAALVGTGLLVWTTITGKSGIGSSGETHLTLGISAAVLAGTMQATTILCIKELGNHGWSSQQIMAHRFHLLCICGLIWAGATSQLLAMTLPQAGILIALATYVVALPLWLLQRGIIRTDPTIASVILTLGPAVTFLTQFADARLSASIFTAAGCAVIIAATAYGVVADTKSSSLNRRNSETKRESKPETSILKT